MARRNQPVRTITEVEVVLHEYDEKFLYCRGRQHDWNQIGLYRLPEGLIVVRSVCRRCTGVVNQHWGSDGTRYPSAYQMPDGYSIRGLFVSKADLRLEIMKRSVIYDSFDEMMAAQPRGRRQNG